MVRLGKIRSSHPYKGWHPCEPGSVQSANSVDKVLRSAHCLTERKRRGVVYTHPTSYLIAMEKMMRVKNKDLRDRAKARNAKRWTAAYKKEAEEWKEASSRATLRASRAERAIATAREDGANQILRTEFLPEMVKDISYHLAREYGPKIAEAAQQLTRTHRGYEPWKIDLNARMDDISKETVIRGVIPELRFHMVTRVF